MRDKARTRQRHRQTRTQRETHTHGQDLYHITHYLLDVPHETVLDRFVGQSIDDVLDEIILPLALHGRSENEENRLIHFLVSLR